MPVRPVVPIREFVDASGVRWSVWSTVPDMRGVMGSMQGGWLTFESAIGRRRLVPIPPEWESASTGTLRDLCGRAEAVRVSPRTGSFRVDPNE
ncbi:MAG TPA: hypothetical protein VN600_02755 [Gemmatimonadaceae bacterium]|nr:hypothetical protein [Gemmatimonadaceae bacterium]